MKFSAELSAAETSDKGENKKSEKTNETEPAAG